MDVFKEVKERVDIVEAAKLYGLDPDRAGKCLCPFHAERTPSFSLSRVKKIWHCFGCGAGGDVVSLTGKLLNLRPIEAARRLNEDFSLGIEELVGRKYTPEERRKFKRERDEKERRRKVQAVFDAAIEEVRQLWVWYTRTLRYWFCKFAPTDPGEEPDPRFVFAMQNLSRAEGLGEMFDRADPAELLDWYTKNRDEILKYEALRKEYSEREEYSEDPF